jgi:hypothetical protein
MERITVVAAAEPAQNTADKKKAARRARGDR